MKQTIALTIAALLTTTAGMAQHRKTAAKQQYPMTQTYDHNPLFVQFPSPLWQSNEQGPFYSADPTARVWNIGGKEVLYLYPSHDLEPGRSYEQSIEVKSESNHTYLANMTRNEWTRYSLNIKQEGLYNITVRMRQNGTADSRFTLCVDGNHSH